MTVFKEEAVRILAALAHVARQIARQCYGVMRRADMVGVTHEIFGTALPVGVQDEALRGSKGFDAVGMKAKDRIEHPGGTA